MSSTPVPSHLVLLEDLATVASGTKVRFLGCIHSYDLPTSTLHLVHAKAQVHVDIALLLETLRPETTTGGAWINVIGYLQPPASQSPGSGPSAGTVVSKTRSREGQGSAPKGTSVHGQESAKTPPITVQALMLWSAGAIDVGAYETAVRGRKEVAAIDREAAERGG